MSKSKRIKVQIPTINSRDEAEAVMNELALAANNQRKFLAARDAEILRLNTFYERPLYQCADSIHTKTEQLRAWAETNRDQFPNGRKSIDFVSGVLGFRTGTPKLALLSRRWTWEKVLAGLKLRRLVDFVRTKEEVNKDAILETYTPGSPHDDSTLASWGVRVTQDESFFIEPKLADMDARQVASPARTSESARPRAQQSEAA